MNRRTVYKTITAFVGIAVFVCLIYRCFWYDRQKQEQVPDGIQVTQANDYFQMLLYSKEEQSRLEYFMPLNEGEKGSFLTCGQFRDMLWEVVDKKELNYEAVKAYFPERFLKVSEDDLLYKEEFFDVYEGLVHEMAQLPEEECHVRLKSLYLVASKEDNQVLCQDGNLYEWEKDLIAQNMDRYIDVYTWEDTLLYVKAVRTDYATIYNAYLQEGEKNSITFFLSNVSKTYETAKPLPEKIEQQIGDVHLFEGKVVGLSMKPDRITGKVLLAGKDRIEIEGYGVLELDENYRIYKTAGKLTTEQTNSILVGYSITDFVVSGKKICAAIIKEELKADHIRVIISTSAFASLSHKEVKLTSDCGFTVYAEDSQTSYLAGEVVTFDMHSPLLSKGRIRIEPNEIDGKIGVLNITRSGKNPYYRGVMEVNLGKNGLNLINELSIEQYLYSVVPSEMPTSYGLEALKVQAVCARSYAIKQLMANRYSAYGAHVDDSVNCQVYQNVEENESSILAVKDTYGQVLTHEGEIITAYYFSTSCGHTASIEDVWESASSVPYLTGRLQTEDQLTADLSQETDFRNFINDNIVVAFDKDKTICKERQVTTFDRNFLMYRWSVTMSLEQLSKQVNASVAKRYRSYPLSLLTYVGKEGECEEEVLKNARVIAGMVFAPQPVTQIGDVVNMQVISRGKSGIIKDMIIIGTKKTILVSYQTNVRTLLAPVDCEVTRADQSTISGMSLLPSAFCYLDPIYTESKITGFKIIGGGFGHGTGMSQNGVKEMVSKGLTYEEILGHFYQDSDLNTIYY